MVVRRPRRRLVRSQDAATCPTGSSPRNTPVRPRRSVPALRPPGVQRRRARRTWQPSTRTVADLVIDRRGPDLRARRQRAAAHLGASREAMRYCIGADVAEGLEHGDYSCRPRHRRQDRRVVACFHARIDADLFGSDVLFNLGRWYNQALIGVESNNHGLTTNKALHRVGYTPAVQAARPVNRGAHCSPPRCSAGAPPRSPSPSPSTSSTRRCATANCTSSTPTPTPSCAPSSVRATARCTAHPHDDRVMALAIAAQMLKYVWLREYQPVTEPPPGTFGWFEKMMFGELDKDARCKDRTRPPIGTHYVRSR